MIGHRNSSVGAGGSAGGVSIPDKSRAFGDSILSMGCDLSVVGAGGVTGCLYQIDSDVVIRCKSKFNEVGESVS